MALYGTAWNCFVSYGIAYFHVIPLYRMVLHGIALLALARGLYLARHLSTLDMSLLFSTTIENEKKSILKRKVVGFFV